MNLHPLQAIFVTPQAILIGQLKLHQSGYKVGLRRLLSTCEGFVGGWGDFNRRRVSTNFRTFSIFLAGGVCRKTP